MAGESGGFSFAAAHAFLDVSKSFLTREADMSANEFKTKRLAFSFPIDMSMVLDQAVRGFLTPDAIQQIGRKYGFICSVYNEDFFTHSTKFTVGAGGAPNLDDSMLGFLVHYQGPNPAGFKHSIDFHTFSGQEGLDLTQILVLLNRQNIDEAYATYSLHRLGFRDPSVRDALVSLRNEVPPIADLIRFAVRDAFNPVVVSQYGYADEYPQILDKYISWQGLGWETGYQFPAAVTAEGVARPAHNASWGEISWAAHWELPSPTQGYDMVHMLYPQSRHGPSPYVFTAAGGVDPDRVFTEEDLAQLLKTADYPIYWRKRMTAISYPPLTRVDVRRMHELGLIDEAGVYHNYRAQGYDDRNAQYLTQFTIAKERPDTKGEICRFWNLGIISEAQARVMLRDNRYSDLEIEAIVTKCRLSRVAKEIGHAIDVIHKSNLQGQIDEGQSRALLAQAGIQGERIEQHLRAWRMERAFGQREITLRLLSEWYRERVITREDFIGRLQRLNYRDIDITQILAAQSLRRERLEEAALAKIEKNAEKLYQQARRNGEKAVAEAQKRAKAVIAAVGKPTDKDLVAWWTAGIITVPEIKRALLARGLTGIDADRWMITNLKESENAQGEEESSK